jgi:hypothetical protein
MPADPGPPQNEGDYNALRRLAEQPQQPSGQNALQWLRRAYNSVDEAGDQFASGVRTPLFEGPTQFAAAHLPQWMLDYVDWLNNVLVDKGAPLARMPEGGIPEFQRQRMAELEKAGVTRSMPYVAGVSLGSAVPGVGWWRMLDRLYNTQHPREK